MGNPIERPNHDPSAGDHHRRESNEALPPVEDFQDDEDRRS